MGLKIYVRPYGVLHAPSYIDEVIEPDPRIELALGLAERAHQEGVNLNKRWCLRHRPCT